MQNVLVVSMSRPRFHVFFPMVSALAFGVSLIIIICSGKWIKLFTETLLAFNLNFQHYTTALIGKPSPPFKRALNSGLDKILGFYIYLLCICTGFLPLKVMGIHTNQYALIRA
jgi:hypothetical protein